MLAEEKARQLIESMAAKFPPQSQTSFNVWRGATLCAVIACKEAKNQAIICASIHGKYDNKEFWEKVETELDTIIKNHYTWEKSNERNEGDRPFGVHP